MSDAASAHLFVVQWRAHPLAPWGSWYPHADAPSFDTAADAEAEANAGETGQSRILCYALVSVGETITLPVDEADRWFCPTCGDSACALDEGHAMSEQCNLCGRKLVIPTASVSLCGTCHGAAREGGRQAAEADRYAREVGA